jgi:aryl-alcohol dehydrogenase-like predicted oxidoreductase
LGKWFKRTGKRDQIFLATKFGFVKGSKTFETDSSGRYTKKACEESLRRLGVDSIDLCKHFPFLKPDGILELSYYPYW